MEIDKLNVSNEVKQFLFDVHEHCEEINEPVYKYSDVVKLIEMLNGN